MLITMAEQNILLKTTTDNNLTENWKESLSLIKENVPYITFHTWFLPLKPISYDNDKLTIQVPNNFFIEWIEGHYNNLFKSSISKCFGDQIKIYYTIKEDITPFDIEIKIEEEEQVFKKTTERKEEKSENKYENFLNSRYTFANFIKGEGNQLARAAALAISDNPGQTSFNPFFVYGGVGLGKTHLIQAIGNRIADLHPEKKVIYLSSDAFTVQFIEAITTHKEKEFSNFYKSMDALIIDDIQFLIGKEKTQDLFFQIFNTLHQSGKQIVLSSDKPPKDLKGLDERMISRFQWGLSVDIQPPDLETRLAILSKKSQLYGISLSPEILEYIASNITSNVRELEGCLIKLLANASLNSREIDFELVKKTVKEISTGKKENISIDLITKIVAEYFRIDENKLREKNRKKEIALARQITMYLCKKMTNHSLKTIGLNFGGRDHSTVIHAIQQVEKLKDTDDSISKDINYIISMFKI